MNLDQAAFEKMSTRYRANFFNHLNGFKSANLIGTQSGEGRHNLAIFNSVIHLGANPPLMGFILRPTTVDRHTYNNIKTVKHYTINHVHTEMIDQAHQTSAKYDEAVSEFEACHFTPEVVDNITAPFVKESFIKIGLRYSSEYLIQENDTILIVGEVIYVELDENYIDTDGTIQLEQANTVAISGLDSYFSVNKLKQLPYARTTDSFSK